MTSTVTGLPSRMRSTGPGEVPLYPMVQMMRVGASSTVTGAMRRVKSALTPDCADCGEASAGEDFGGIPCIC